MTAKFKLLTFKTGDVLLRENEQGQLAYLIKTGKVDIRKGARTDSPRSLGGAGPGEIIGEFALFDGMPHCAEAIAMEDVTAIAISREEFQARIANLDPVVRSMIQHMVKCARRMADMLRPEDRAQEWYLWNKAKK